MYVDKNTVVRKGMSVVLRRSTQPYNSTHTYRVGVAYNSNHTYRGGRDTGHEQRSGYKKMRHRRTSLSNIFFTKYVQLLLFRRYIGRCIVSPLSENYETHPDATPTTGDLSII